MNLYFFNFRKGDEVFRDSLGMYLPNLDDARAEAMQTCHDLLMVAELTGEPANNCELLVADASGEEVLCLPLQRTAH